MRQEGLKKTAAIIFFSIYFLFTINLFEPLLAQEEKSEVSVSVPENPVNQLAKKINELKEIIKQKKQEFKEKKRRNLNIFLILTGVAILVGISLSALNSYFRHQEKQLKRLKRKYIRRSSKLKSGRKKKRRKSARRRRAANRRKKINFYDFF
jgi:hypothetical protein